MEIKGIIKEELQSLLKEGYVMEHDNFKFQQKIENPGFHNFQSFSNDHDVDVIESDIYANWRIGFSLNERGVEKFLVQVDSVVGTYKVELRDKQSDENVQELDKNIAENNWKFQILEANLILGSELFMENLTFDFATQICNVEFYDPNNQI
jgi:hypothetical protein